MELGGLNCTALVPRPLDSSPGRSPQAVHTLLAHRFAGKRVVEIGTMRGDGVACFAASAASAVAIEHHPPYCRRLRERSASLAAAGRRNFTVRCEGYETGLPSDFDVVTWWQMAPHLLNEEVLARLRSLQARGRLRSPVEAVVLFDSTWKDDRMSWKRLSPLARWHEKVAFDERQLCISLAHNATAALRHKCNKRGFGFFIVAGFDVAPTPAPASPAGRALSAARTTVWSRGASHESRHTTRARAHAAHSHTRRSRELLAPLGVGQAARPQLLRTMGSAEVAEP